MIALLRALGVAAPIAFAAVFFWEGSVRPHYRARRHFVSLLALGDRGWVQTVNFLVCGVSLVAFATTAIAVHATGHYGPLAIGSIGVFGVALILAGVFPTDPALGYPPGVASGWPDVQSRRGAIHGVSGVLGFAALAAGCIAGAWHAMRTGDVGWAIYAGASGLGVVALFITTGVLAESIVRGRRSDAPVGWAQRGAIILILAFVVVCALGGR
jgi:hypothetical membrane protein